MTMRKRDILKRIAAARAAVDRIIVGNAERGGYGAALSGEGYHGGYRAALDDIVLFLNGTTPQRNGWWKESDDDRS